jgi:hypothetical protein
MDCQAMACVLGVAKVAWLAGLVWAAIWLVELALS